VEPNPQNVEILRQNLSADPGSFLVQAAAWSGETCLTFDDGRRGNESKVSGAGAISVRACTLDTVMREGGLASVDLLKMDIEGAERAVFLEGPLGFLDRTRAILIEFHGADLERDITAVLCARGFKLMQRGRKHYFLRTSS
jgi:FkbM family methyltransferase